MKRIVLTTVVAFIGSLSAHAVTLGFEDVPTQNFSTPIQSGGFSFSFAGGWFIGPGSLSGFSFSDSGSSRIAATANTTLTFSPIVAAPFSLTQVFGAVGQTNLGPGTLVLTGFLSGGGTVSQILNVTGTYQTIAIDPAFTNLASVQVTGANGIGLDNLLINESPSSAVPEPASMTMVALGLAACGLYRKRSRRCPAGS